MLRLQGERLLLGCTAERAVLLALRSSTAGAEVLATVAVAALHTKSMTSLCEALQGLTPRRTLSKANRARLYVTLDDALVRSFVVTPPNGARALQELRACAAARFAALYGEAAEHWRLTADWRATIPFVACALPRELDQGLESLARTRGWRLDSIRPALIRVWNRLHASIPADGWIIVGFGRTLTLVHTRNDQVAGLRSLNLPGAPDFAELETLIGQERIRAAGDAGERHRQSLLWTGAADWLPVAATITGLASRVISLRAQAAPDAELAQDNLLALAGLAR